MFWNPLLIGWIVVHLNIAIQPVQKALARPAQRRSTGLRVNVFGARELLQGKAPIRSSIPRIQSNGAPWSRRGWEFYKVHEENKHRPRPLERGGGVGD